MSATRMTRVATLTAGLAVWIVAAALLWRTRVPGDLRLPTLNERSIFGAELVRRAEHYERFFYVEWVLGTIAAFAVLAWMVRRGARIARSLGLGPVNAGIVLGAVTFTVLWAVSLPFALASEWWQHRYGISTGSYAEALGASWGGLLLTVLVGVVLLAGLLGLAKRYRAMWWVAAVPLLVAVSAALQLVIPYVASIDSHPLRDPELAAAIDRLEQLEHAGDPEVLEQKVSDQTTAANAYAIGIGPSERVVFWDTLLDGRFNDHEVRFVAAHELAHLARKHIPKGLAWFTLFLVPILGAVAYFTGRRGGLRNPATVPLALLVIVAAQLVSQPLQSAISRRYEAEADWVALNATHDPAAARGLFRRFAKTSLEDPTPPWWAHILLGDHPTALERIEQAAAWRSRYR
jgi:Zn-dependent protease with chaperone function